MPRKMPLHEFTVTWRYADSDAPEARRYTGVHALSVPHALVVFYRKMAGDTKSRARAGFHIMKVVDEDIS